VSSIEFEQVTKRFPDGTLAVEDLNVAIADGEFMIFVGPSGCGKTTALRMVAGLEEISAGKITLDGRVINEVDAADRDIAMVFQNYALYPHMSVKVNLGFPLRSRRMSREQTAARVREVAVLLGIEELLERKPRELSGGQRQRVAMGRAIVRHPQAFLMDEPLSNLDAKLRVQMRAELVKLHRTLGVTTIYVTHDQTEAMTLGQRVTVMNRGVMQQVDPPQDLYDWPVNTFVASFIGSPPMNFVRGGLESGRVRFGNLDVALPGDSLSRVDAPRRDVIIGLRPESLVAAGEDACGHTVRGQVEVVERLGSESFVYFQAAGLDVLEVGERPIELHGTLCARMPPGIQFEPGDLMELEVKSDLLRLFEEDTGKAVLAPRNPRSPSPASPTAARA
jgi:multiple sugar transport system ATP-binding protein